MNISRTKISIFFVAMLILGWLLYPRELFLGYIYEGTRDLHRAEEKYLHYLSRHPNNKFAISRLAHLYERMGEPKKATPYFESLYFYRSTDWKIAEQYLNHLENLHDEEKLYLARLTIARNFRKLPLFPEERVETLYQDALEYALWNQKYSEAYEILQGLMLVSDHPGKYEEKIKDLDRGLQQTKKVLDRLQNELRENPRELESRLELAQTLFVEDRPQEARLVIEEGFNFFPNERLLVKLRAWAAQKMGDWQTAVKDVSALLAHGKVRPSDQKELRRQLAFFYQQMKQPELAYKEYEKILHIDENDKEAWQDMANSLMDLKRVDEALLLIQRYLLKFENQPEWKKTLVELYLYEKKDLSQIEAYQNYIQESRDKKIGLDVAYLFLDQHLEQRALSWLLFLNQAFSLDRKIITLLVDTLIRLEDYEQALTYALTFLKAHPRDREMLVQVASLYSLQAENREAKAYYKQLAMLYPRDVETLLIVGRELYYLGQADESLGYLESAKALKPEDPRLWYWLSEVHLFLNENKKSLVAARRVRDLIRGKKHLSEEWTRFHLKSEGRIHFDNEVLLAYAKAKGRNPNDEDLQTDFIDLLLEKKRAREAKNEIAAFKASFKKKASRMLPYEVRLAFLENRFQDAVNLLNEIISTKPNLWSHRRDRAETYGHLGQWKKAILEFEAVAKATGDELHVFEPLKALHERFDNRAGFFFQWNRLGNDQMTGGRIRSRYFLTEKLELKGEGGVDVHEVGGRGDDITTTFALLSLSIFPLPDWMLSLGTGFASNEERTTIFPRMELLYESLHGSKFDLQASLRELRRDLPSAVVAGALMDTIYLEGQYPFLDRFSVTGIYAFERNYLKNGAGSLTHRFQPALYYRFLKKPFVQAGYQYLFYHAGNDGNFFNSVPLIPDMRVHTLVGLVSHPLASTLLLEGSFFIGEDTKRDLHFFEGDLWGFGGRMKWDTLDWLTLESSYDYGKETRLGVGGVSHQLKFELSGHW